MYFLSIVEAAAFSCSAESTMFPYSKLNVSRRVGNGLTDAELETVREKLKPYFVPYSQKPKNYKVTNSKKVQPDLWVKDVSKSIVLQVSISTNGQAASLQLDACL